MNIAIETSALSTAHSVRGIGSYTRLLLKALHTYDKRNSYSFFTDSLPADKPVDIVHYTYFDLFRRTSKLYKGVTTIVTIHDVIPLEYPRQFPVGIRGKFAWLFQKSALSRVDAVVTDSHASKKAILKHIHLPENRVHVVYPCCDEVFQPITSSDLTKLGLSKRYGLPRRYLLYVGDVNWNKNIPMLLRAFAAGKKISEFRDLSLVLVGEAFGNTQLSEVHEINMLIQTLGIFESVIRPGFIPNSDLVGLYNGARAYIQPSFAEGFGLPVLEAMRCKIPVVISRAGSLPEIGGSSVYYINPHNREDLERAISKVLRFSPGERKANIEEGYKQANRFTLSKFAKEIVHLYETIS